MTATLVQTEPEISAKASQRSTPSPNQHQHDPPKATEPVLLADAEGSHVLRGVIFASFLSLLVWTAVGLTLAAIL